MVVKIVAQFPKSSWPESPMKRMPRAFKFGQYNMERANMANSPCSWTKVIVYLSTFLLKAIPSKHKLQTPEEALHPSVFNVNPTKCNNWSYTSSKMLKNMERVKNCTQSRGATGLWSQSLRTKCGTWDYPWVMSVGSSGRRQERQSHGPFPASYGYLGILAH